MVIISWFQLLFFTALYPGVEVFLLSTDFLHISESPHHTGTVRWQFHNTCILLACIQRFQTFASIDGRGGKWRIKSSSLIDPLNLASSRNSSLGHGTKVLSSMLEYL